MHPPLQRLLLRALARAGGAAGGGTTPIPVVAAAAGAHGLAIGPARATGWREQQKQQPSSLLLPLLSSRGFASRGPSFLDQQARRAMKQKRQVKQRQRLLRELFCRGTDRFIDDRRAASGVFGGGGGVFEEASFPVRERHAERGLITPPL